MSSPNTTNEVVQTLVDGLCQPQKLLRDRGLVHLKQALDNLSPAALASTISVMLAIVEDTGRPWESRHGCLEGLRLLALHPAHGSGGGATHEGEEWGRMRRGAAEALTDEEVRVRQAAGNLLGALCSVDGGETYALLKDTVLGLVRNNLDRQPLDVDSGGGGSGDGGGDGGVVESVCQLKHKLVDAAGRERRLSGGGGGGSDAAQIFHDTAGWRNLETSLTALQAMIAGTGDKFSAHISGELVQVVVTTLTHANRFVRETGYGVCAALVSSGFAGELSDGPLSLHGDVLVQHLALGLADNWSQVRLAASVATRQFLCSLPPNARHACFPILLPRICLNRYYVAEGVRLYSQETWRRVAGTEGRALVEQHMEHVVQYYITASAADNHAVREAACACIAELVAKLPGSAVQPHVPALLNALLLCFTDDSWPVRDAACVACGNFIHCFPEEARPSMERLYPLFCENLQDSIPSVRAGAAAALGDVVRSYGEEAVARLQPLAAERLQGVSEQSNEAERYSTMDTGPAAYGAAKYRRDNDASLHEDKQMYSCGSLAPKMGRGGGGCSDCKFRRPPQPWEAGDGAVLLVGELALAGGQHAHDCVLALLEDVATACRHQHYTAHVSLLETLCKVLPRLLSGLGKHVFKQHLHLFLDHVFRALECENSLTTSAASQCLTALTKDIGPNILRGRIEEHNPRYLSAFDANSYSAPF